jgi:3-phosphoshikimate 1-carboxyvinyltransferase
VPGDKSISHRALMFGALAVGTTRIEGLLEGEDVLRTAAAMRALGAEVERTGPARGGWRGAASAGWWTGRRAGHGQFRHRGAPLAGLLAGHPLFAVLTGDASLRARPMRRVTEPLAATGPSSGRARAGGLPWPCAAPPSRCRSTTRCPWPRRR